MRLSNGRGALRYSPRALAGFAAAVMAGLLVVANAFIFIFERFLSRFLLTLPPGMRFEEQLLYSVHVVMILVTFTVGVLLVPSLTASIFSGRSGESTLPARLIAP